MPMQYYRRVSDIGSVQWEFGHGLSYTTFAYSNLQVRRTATMRPEAIREAHERDPSQGWHAWLGTRSRLRRCRPTAR